jgi:transcriptional/translational regulatory protein YebC/TACO1
MFEKKGYIVVENDAVDEDTLMEVAIDAGAEDVIEDDSNYEIITDTKDFEAVKAAIEAQSIPYIDAEITMLPQSTVNLQGKEAEQMVNLMETLEDCDDVQKVYTNADIPEEFVSG